MRKALLGLVLVATACSGDGGSASSPTTVPREVAALNEALAALDGVMGDLQRILMRERRITPEVTDRLQAIYTGPELLNQIDAFRTDVANGMAGYKNPPGNRVTTVSRVITASPICTFVEVLRDYGPVAQGLGSRPETLYVILVTKHEADDPQRLNPTGWAMLYDGIQEDRSQPEDVCRS